MIPRDNFVTPLYPQYLSFPARVTGTLAISDSDIEVTNFRFIDDDDEDNVITPGITGGVQDSGNFKFTTNNPGTYVIIIDVDNDGDEGTGFNPDDLFGLGDIFIRGETISGELSIPWNGRTNLGTALPNGSYQAKLQAITGEYHFVATDMEHAGPGGGGINIRQAFPSGGTSTTAVYWDDITGLQSDNTNLFQCSGASCTSLPNGIVDGFHSWGHQSGGFSNSEQWLGNLRFLDTYVYGAFSVSETPVVIISDGSVPNPDDPRQDYGDAPDTYGTDKTGGNSGTEAVGASHGLAFTFNTTYLGSNLPDGELDALTPLDGTGDDLTGDAIDEDGVSSFDPISSLTTNYAVTVNVNNASGEDAYLVGWIDFDRSGTFEASEGVVSLAIADGTGDAPVTLNWSGLNPVPGTTYARFRISTDPQLDPTKPDATPKERFTEALIDGEVEDYALTISDTLPDLDYGDAPDTLSGTQGIPDDLDLDYKTRNGDGGAAHTVSDTLKMGTLAGDVDSGTLQNTIANADDVNDSDDEDGVSLASLIASSDASYSATVTVTNTTGADAYLVGWVDFNQNGVFDTGEGQTTVSPIPTGTDGGTFTLNWTGLSGLTAGTTYARFRLSNTLLTTDTVSSIGLIGIGEVEDYAITIADLDYGDAPDSYLTTNTNNGAAHTITNLLQMGAGFGPDGDDGTLGNATASADDNTVTDDENGVSLPSLSQDSSTYIAPVIVTNNTGTDAYLVGWVDFDQDGSFEPSEGVLYDSDPITPGTQPIPTGTAQSSLLLAWSGLSGLTTGNTYARFRLSDSASLTTATPGGRVGSGEVEDYELTITTGTSDYGDAPDTASGTGSGNYQTLATDDGPSHTLNPNLYMGVTGVDIDDGTLQDDTASADNNAGIADEDGVTLPASFTNQSTSYSATVNVTNTTGADAYLVGWVDLNRNGAFAADEGVLQTIPNGTINEDITLNWTFTPVNAGITYARFRLSSSNTLTTSTPTGAVGSGEVEDYRLDVATATTDWGDAPDGAANTGTGNYRTVNRGGTATGDDGPSHYINPALKMGNRPGDQGVNEVTQQNATATADDVNSLDDEDGVTLPTIGANASANASTYSATVNVTNTIGKEATLVGWVDFNKNGSFDSGEGASRNIPTGTIATDYTLTWSVPSGITAGTTFARFRLSDSASLTTSSGNGGTGTLGNGEVEDYQVAIKALDYGDAPDTGSGTGLGNYQTLASDDGPDHIVNADLRMGSNPVDADNGNLQDIDASADGTDDNDGVTFPTTLYTDNISYTAEVTVTNNTGGDAYLLGWIDFDADGKFESSEGVLYDFNPSSPGTQPIPTGTSNQNVTLTWTNLSGLVAGTTYARFRITDDANLTIATPTGDGGEGEVEDYKVTIVPEIPKDYGDAPDALLGTSTGNYQTRLSQGGPRHEIVANLSLGAAIDADNGTLHNPDATADDTSNTGSADDEEAIDAFPALTVALVGQPYTVPVKVTNNTGSDAYLVGYIDFNKDGDFLDTGEESNPVTVPNGTTPANPVDVSFTVPAGLTTGSTFARFRLATLQVQVEDSFGLATSGEVEDYAITIGAGKPKLLLVKRMTRLIPGDGDPEVDYSTTIVNDGVANSQDDSTKWPVNYLGGVLEISDASPGDIVEYTVYFLNAGESAATNVRICDPLSQYLQYITDTYTGETPTDGGLPFGLGLRLTLGSVAPSTVYLTGEDDSPDRGEFITPGVDLTGTCTIVTDDNDTPLDPSDDTIEALTSILNTNGVVIVEVTGVGAGRPTEVDNVTDPTDADDDDAFGFIRFRARVK